MRKLLVLAILLIESNAIAQKMMMLPPGFETDKERFQVTLARKLFESSFAEYKATSFRQQHVSFRSRQSPAFSFERLFSNYKEKEINIRRSFFIITPTGDTAMINISRTSTLNFTNGSEAVFARSGQRKPDTFRGGQIDFYAQITTNRSEEVWVLHILTREVAQTINQTMVLPLEGSVITPAGEIAFEVVGKYEDGKKPIYTDRLGIILANAGKQVAGVQFQGLPLKFQKQNFIWLPREGDTVRRLYYAATLATIMGHLHDTEHGSIEEEQ